MLHPNNWELTRVECRIRPKGGNLSDLAQRDPTRNLFPQEVFTTHRSEIAALKRRVLELERQLRRVGRGGPASRPVAANEDSVSPGTRFSAKSMAAQRKRLGLSAAQCGLLIGASGQSVYNWDQGKAGPRAQHLPAIFALRNLGRRQANEILEARKAA